MKNFQSFLLILSIFLCECLLPVIVVGQYSPVMISFGDFMEYIVTYDKVCHSGFVSSTIKNSSSELNLGVENHLKFWECTNQLGSGSTESKDYFEDLRRICANPDKYMNCWNTLQIAAIEKCGTDKLPYLPAVFKFTTTSFCAEDKGVKNIAALKKAYADINQTSKEDCGTDTKTHWLDICQPLMSAMTSENLCIRHSALSKCLAKTICPGDLIGNLVKTIYSDGGKQLRCQTI